MNKWVEKSVKLANSYGYLDKLLKVYPVNLTMNREISEEEKDRIKKVLLKKNRKELIKVLLEFKKFPIDDPYIGFIRKDKSALDKNPKTVSRISRRLLRLGLEGILSGICSPESPSRQMGQMFRKWLVKLGYPILPKEKFIKYKGTAILKGGDESLKNFARENLGYKRQKGLDLVLKTKNSFVLGEAKLITRSGGTQDKSFREAISFIKSKNNKNIIKMAILDGVVWLSSGDKKLRNKKNLYENIRDLKSNQIALSSLILRDFIKSLE